MVSSGTTSRACLATSSARHPPAAGQGAVCVALLPEYPCFAMQLLCRGWRLPGKSALYKNGAMALLHGVLQSRLLHHRPTPVQRRLACPVLQIGTANVPGMRGLENRAGKERSRHPTGQAVGVAAEVDWRARARHVSEGARRVRGEQLRDAAKVGRLVADRRRVQRPRRRAPRRLHGLLWHMSPQEVEACITLS